MLPHFTMARHRWLSGFHERVRQSGPSLFYAMDAPAGATTQPPVQINPYAAGTATYQGSEGVNYTLQQGEFCIGGKSVTFGGSANPSRLITSASGQAFSGTTPNQVPTSMMVTFNADASGHGTFPVLLGKVLYFAQNMSDFPMSLRWDPATSRVILRLDRGNDWVQDLDLATTPLSTGVDYLIHAVHRNTGANGVEIWVNGVLNVTGTMANTPAPATSRFWTIGGATPFSQPASDSAFKGRIGEAAFWNKALSQYEIEQQQAARPPYVSGAYITAVLADSPLGYWRLGESSGTTANDSSGNARHGTYAGSTLPTLGATGMVYGDVDTAVNVTVAGGRIEVPYGAWMNVAAFTAEGLCNLSTAGAILSRRYAAADGTDSTFTLRAAGSMVLVTNSPGAAEYAPILPWAAVTGAAHHLAGSYDGVNVKLYKDGLLYYARRVNSPLNLPTAGTLFGLTSRTALSDYATEGCVGIGDELAYYGSALSQARIKAHAVAAGFTVTDYTLANVVATARAVWALRGLNGYTGALIDVRRSSDNATRTISVSAGELDTADLLTWAGSDSVYVSKWYDQSGNGHHLLQATNANQPRIVNAGALETEGGDPIINCVSTTFLEEASVIGNTDSFSILACMDGALALGRGQDTMGTGWSIDLKNTTFSVVLTDGGAVSYSAAGLSSGSGFQTRCVQLKNTTGASKLATTQAGTERAQTSAAKATLRSSTRGFVVGLSNGASTPGKIGELMVWRSVINHGQIAVVTDNQVTRFGYTPA